MHLKHIVRREVKKFLTPSVETYNDYVTEFSKIGTFNHIDVYNSLKTDFEQFIDDQNYLAILKVYNCKGMIYTSKVGSLCDLNPSKYCDQVKNLIRTDCEEGKRIITAMKEYIEEGS